MAEPPTTLLQIEAYIHTNWRDIAVFAYKNYQEKGRGTVIFIEGIQGNAFGLTKMNYATRDEFAEFWVLRLDLGKELKYVDTYNPDQSLTALIFQTQPAFGKWGVEQSLPAPKTVWEAHKDEPDLQED